MGKCVDLLVSAAIYQIMFLSKGFAFHQCKSISIQCISGGLDTSYGSNMNIDKE